MKKIIWLLIPILLLLLFYSFSSDETDENYFSSVEKEISNRHKYLAFNEHSPFNQFNVVYQKPSYYPIDKKYKVNASVERIKERQIIILNASNGEPERYQKFAWLKFSLDGQLFRLLVLKPVGFGADKTLFCGFADDTSGKGSYGGGRYLDVTIGKSNKTSLDFNLAYNPYCAYIDEYICPLPPPENILAIAIEAGERVYKIE